MIYPTYPCMESNRPLETVRKRQTHFYQTVLERLNGERQRAGVQKQGGGRAVNCKKFYEEKGQIHKFRIYRERYKRNYRKKTGSGKYQFREWDFVEDAMVLRHDISDRELSKIIQRSVTAIQIRRSRLKSNQV